MCKGRRGFVRALSPMQISVSLLFAVLVASVSATNVLDLDTKSWDKTIGKGKPGLVEFYAPWCEHCETLAPTYEELADAYSHARDKLFVARIDADGIGRELGEKYGILGYPTLKWFSADGTAEPYSGDTSLYSFTNFITRRTNVKSSITPRPPHAFTVLDYSNFDDIVLDKKKDVLVTFTADWAISEEMINVYERVGAIFENEENCVFAYINIEDHKNSAIKSRYRVVGLPALKFFSKDNKQGEVYYGGRHEADYVNYLNERCGTYRSLDGALSTTAGRVADFDDLARQFFVGSSSTKKSIHKKALKLSHSVGDTAKPYLHIMEKMIKNKGYYEKESKR
ncbi:thioredoxin-like protein [Rhodocollybia butyracea]|uniref:protein disulfide-isomerase n=1 Tax=Rhodocollybia butyracea TaxID=206335 RepID=A0A9P5U5E9_9AGAR|nr:thioredoxin-like protein [Rhodocollybia butyracea]